MTDEPEAPSAETGSEPHLAESSAQSAVASADSRSEFWFVAARTVQSSILIAAPAPRPAGTAVISVYDCDGDLSNQAQISFGNRSVGVIELDPFVEGCKLESGMKHGRVVVESGPGVKHLMRYVSQSNAVMCGELTRVAAEHNVFCPVLFDGERMLCIALLNSSDEQVDVRCRLFLGKRSPELVWNVGTRSTRVLDLAEEFGRLIEGEMPLPARGYLRLTARSETGVRVQFLERSGTRDEQSRFQVVG